MRPFLATLILSALVLSAGATQARQASDPLPVNVGGRVIDEPDGAVAFGWPGVYFETRFHGTAVGLRFDAPVDNLRLLVDGEIRQVFQSPGRVDMAINVPPGDHVLRLEKLSESQTGAGRFFGVFPLGDTTPLPAPARSRQIEFIGDSFTVGYGDTSPGRECTSEQVHAFTDTQQAFGPLTARRFDADYRINAYSGFGVVRNFDGVAPDLDLPTLYPRLTPDGAIPGGRADEAWKPRIIVVNLGTNDFSKPLHAGERWADDAALRTAYRQRYVAFVQSLHAIQPQARFILMGSDAFYAEVEQVSATVNATAPGLASPLHFGGLDLMGCDWHPSLADHARLALLVEGAIGTLPDAWGEAPAA